MLPRFADLEVMLQLLPRSSTAERMNPYTSLWTGVTPGDGPQAFHLVLLDAGRTDVLADAVGRDALHCIRCSACLNVCPVYERTGGHAYESIYPGPIGAILTPQLSGYERGQTLPGPRRCAGRATRSARSRSTSRASSCTCAARSCGARPAPTRRAEYAGERAAMRAMAGVMSSRRRYELAQRAARTGSAPLARDGMIERRLPGPLAGWTAVRDLRAPAAQTFRSWWRERERGG